MLGGAAAADDAGDYQLTGSIVGVLGHTVTGRLSGYVETGWYPAEQADDPAYVGAGLALLLRNDAQLDLSFDRGLSDAASDWLFGAGIGIRL